MIKNYNKRLDFRAWDRQTNSFIPSMYWYIDPAGCARWQANDEEIPSDRIMIQQNTGLVDKNCNSIYEGNIIMFCGDDEMMYRLPGEVSIGEYFTHAKEFFHYGARVRRIDMDDSYFGLNRVNSINFLIVGNIT